MLKIHTNVSMFFYFLLSCLIILSIITNCKDYVPADGIENQDENVNSVETIIENENDSMKISKFDAPLSLLRIQETNYTIGIYLTAYTVASDNIASLLDTIATSGFNTVVFDLKNMHGDIFYAGRQKGSQIQTNVKPIINISKIVKLLHDRNMRAVARIVIFHDYYMADNFQQMRPGSINGGKWQEDENRKPAWLDPSLPEVQKYNLSILRDVANSGIDEIQMDYIRFPTQGDLDQAIFDFNSLDSLLIRQDSTHVCRSKTDIIYQFIKDAKEVCDSQQVKLTADIFAIVAWQRKSDIQNTGQDIKRISLLLDAIHPMIYSSHFSDDFGFREDVHNEPYHLVYRTTRLCRELSDHSCKVIPYIQANNWKVNYKQSYIHAEIQAVKDAGADGFILWNSANNYKKPLSWIKNILVSRET